MSLSKRLARQTAQFLTATAMAALAMILLAPATQAQSTVSVTTDSESGLVGDTLTVPIEVSDLGQVPDSSDITAYGFDISLDTSQVAYLGFETSGTLTEQAGFNINENTDIPRIGAFGTDAINDQGTDSGVLLRLQFEVTSTGSSTVTLSGFQFNAGEPAATPSEPSFGITGANNLVSFPDPFTARDSGQAQPADTVLVPVSTTDLSGQNVTAFEFEMEYDSTVTKPIEVVTDNSLSSSFNAGGNVVSPGVFRVGAFGQSALSGSGTLVFVRMEVVSQGTSPLAFAPGTFQFNDGTPNAATSDGTLDATGLDFTLGDPTMNGSVSALDASFALQEVLRDTMSVSQRAAADVNGNDRVDAEDASLILQFVVGKISDFPAATSSGAAQSQALAARGQLKWGEVVSDGETSALPVRLSGPVGNVYAVSLTLTGDVGALDVDGLSNRLPEGWQLMQRTFDGEGKAKIVMAGAEPISSAGELVRLPLTDNAGSPSIEATGALNGAAQTALGPVPIAERPGSFALRGNSPNPFAQSTTVRFDVPEESSVKVEVYDLLGRRVLSTPARTVSAGEGRSIQLNANDLSSGTYIYRLKAETDGGDAASWTDSGRMVVVK
ncbi:MAG: cohesin domain-containing protein [Candidatus Bipolaricaulia bacterium]